MCRGDILGAPKLILKTGLSGFINKRESKLADDKFKQNGNGAFKINV